MPYSNDYYQSTIPETITVRDQTYVTQDLIDQAKKEYKESRQVVNLINKRCLKTAYARTQPVSQRYYRDDAIFCATHTVAEIMEKYAITAKHAYATRHYLCKKFGLHFITEKQSHK